MKHHMTPFTCRAQRRPNRRGGIALIEALVAMAVMAFGMLAVLGIQSTLRVNADIAKQRSEATRIAEQEIERLRAFKGKESVAAGVDGGKLDWDEVVQLLGTEVKPVNRNVDKYVVNRFVTNVAGSSQKTIAVQVQWTDRLGIEQTVTLGDSLAGASPVLSALAAMPAVRTATTQRSGRHPTIPGRAHDLGDGRSVFKPVESGSVAWTFNNTTGVILSVCTVSVSLTSDGLTATDLTNCTPIDKGQFLSGYIRFNLRGAEVAAGAKSTLTPIAGGVVTWRIDNALQRVDQSCVNAVCNPVVALNPVISPIDPANDPTYSLLAIDSERPQWPSLPLSMSVGVTSSDRPTPSDECFTSAPMASLAAVGQSSVEYFCIIYPDTATPSRHTWNGRPVIVPGSFVLHGDATPWTIGSNAGQYRVCRYTLAASDVTKNIDHPLDYLNVTGNLINQNFLVIDGRKACPTDVAPDPANGDYINTNTRPHQS